MLDTLATTVRYTFRHNTKVEIVLKIVNVAL